MGKKQCIEEIILTSPTGAINQIKGDKTDVMKAIYSLHRQGLIEILTRDSQSNPITYRVTDKGHEVVLNGGYRKLRRKNCRKKLLDNIAQFIANILSKFIGVVIVLAICKALS